MKKAAAVLLLTFALAGSAFASEGFVKNEAERSGAAGTCAMIKNSIGGFFSSLGKLGHPKEK